MAQIVIEGMNLGYLENEYDFEDETGTRRQGVSKRLHVLAGNGVLKVRVPDEMVGTVRALPVREDVTVLLDIPDNARLRVLDAGVSGKQPAAAPAK